MAGFAKLHARFWNDPAFEGEGELSWVELSMRGPFGAMLIDSARTQFADELGSTFDALCALFVEHHERIVDIWDDGEQTLIHGDPHGGNQFLDGDTLGLYDWAVISKSPGIRDVAIYLGNSCPAELRREGQERWIRAYQQGLVDAGVADAPSEAVLWERYRRVVLYAWVAAATTAAMGDKWQPLEVGMAGMRRATAACEDLDTLGALRDVL
jgi:Ser/Thr protein kinase RdoA (MazF antagonist)